MSRDPRPPLSAARSSELFQDFTYVQDADNVVHLADESPLGGLVSGCDLMGEIRVIEPVPAGYLCNECRLNAAGIEVDR